MSQPLGQPVKITFETFSDTTRVTHADPTTATVYVRDPATGTIAPHAWPSGDLTHDATGKFSYTLPDDAAGLVLWRAAATGAVATSTRAGAVSVDEAFPPMLVGLDDVKTETNITATTSDDELTTVIYTASAILLNHPAYNVSDHAQVNSYTEWHDGGTVGIVLRHYPINPAATTVTEYQGPVAWPIAYEPTDTGNHTAYGWTTEDGTGNDGILIRTATGYPTSWMGRVKVAYSTGAAVVPADIRLAVLVLVEHLWETQRGSQGAPLPAGIDLDLAGESTRYTPSYLLPNRVQEALEPYRKYLTA